MGDLLEETILTSEDLVMLDSKRDILFLSRDGDLYLVNEEFSEIDPLKPRVSLKYMGEIAGPSLKEFQPYNELRIFPRF